MKTIEHKLDFGGEDLTFEKASLINKWNRLRKMGRVWRPSHKNKSKFLVTKVIDISYKFFPENALPFRLVVDS